MNGTVAPSANSAAVAWTCAARSFSSPAIFPTCGVFTVDSLMMGGPSLVTAHARNRYVSSKGRKDSSGGDSAEVIEEGEAEVVRSKSVEDRRFASHSQLLPLGAPKVSFVGSASADAFSRAIRNAS